MDNSLLFRKGVVLACVALLTVCVGCERKPAKPPAKTDAVLSALSTEYYDVIAWDEAVALYPKVKFEMLQMKNASTAVVMHVAACNEKRARNEPCSVLGDVPAPFTSLLNDLRAFRETRSAANQPEQIETLDLLIQELTLLQDNVNDKVVFINKRDGSIFFLGPKWLEVVQRGLANYGLRTSHGGILGENVMYVAALEPIDWVTVGATVQTAQSARLKGAYEDRNGDTILPGLKCFDPAGKGLRMTMPNGSLILVDD